MTKTKSTPKVVAVSDKLFVCRVLPERVRQQRSAQVVEVVMPSELKALRADAFKEAFKEMVLSKITPEQFEAAPKMLLRDIQLSKLSKPGEVDTMVLVEEFPSEVVVSRFKTGKEFEAVRTQFTNDKGFTLGTKVKPVRVKKPEVSVEATAEEVKVQA